MVPSSPPPSIFSSDAADKLERAIKYMVMIFLNGGLVQRSDVINLLEEIIQSIQRDPSMNANKGLEDP